MLEIEELCEGTEEVLEDVLAEAVSVHVSLSVASEDFVGVTVDVTVDVIEAEGVSDGAEVAVAVGEPVGVPVVVPVGDTEGDKLLVRECDTVVEGLATADVETLEVGLGVWLGVEVSLVDDVADGVLWEVIVPVCEGDALVVEE